jgi:hypothetical protein
VVLQKVECFRVLGDAVHICSPEKVEDESVIRATTSLKARGKQVRLYLCIPCLLLQCESALDHFQSQY